MRAFHEWKEAFTVNPILESISNSVSAMPASGSIAQAASGQSGAGGFASALAAAQAQAAMPQTAANGSGVLSKTAAGSAGAPTYVSAAASGNPRTKKSVNGTVSGPVNLSLSASLYSVAAVTAAVVRPAVIPGSNPIASSQLPSTQQQPGLLQTSSPPVMTGVVRVDPAEVAPGVSQPDPPTVAFGSTSSNAAITYLASSQVVTGQISNQIVLDHRAPTQISFNPTTLNLTGPNLTRLDQGAPSQPSLNRALLNQTAASPTTGSDGLLTAPAKVLGNPASAVAQGSSMPNVGAPASALQAENAQSSSLAPSFEQFTSNPPTLPTVAQDSQGGGITANQAALLASKQTVDPALAPETLLATANPQTGAVSGGISFSDGKLQGIDAGSTSVATPDTAVQTDLPAQGASGSSLVEIMNGQMPAAPVPTSPALETVTKAASQVAAVKVTAATTSPSAHGAGQGTEAPAAPNSNSTSTSPALTTGSESGSHLTVASQTPFSIFFSGPGPGSESAASTLPKVILPVAGSAIRGSHATGTEAPSANPQTANPQTMSSQGGIRQSPAQPNTKDALSGTENGTSQNPQTVRAESDGSAAATSVPAVSAQIAVPVPASAISTGVTVPASGPSAVSDGQPPQTPPPPPSASPATTPPAPPQPAVLGTVQVAQLVNRLGQSEMRIGLNTSAFGNVEVRTTVRTSDVGLVIGSEKGDLRTLLANDMPAIANTLQQQNLRLNSVNFMQGFAFSNNNSGGGDSQQRSFVPTRGLTDSSPSEASPEDSADTPPASGWGGGSISILA
jgi:flagellar hook-length control protein FliK